MPDLKTGLVQPFLGALQACTSVLLTLLYGVITRQANLINDDTINQMSAICVKIFLPALILVKLGSELSLEIASHYIPVFVWSILYTIVSIGFGHVFSRCLHLPTWVTPAVTFNNTSSLPLLLLQTLQSTGSLKLITMPDQSESDCMNRAQSYFLVCAVVSKTMAYALGPRMLGHKDASRDNQENHHDDEESGSSSSNVSNEQEEELDEQTSLLPNPIQKARQRFSSKSHRLLHTFIPGRVRHRIDSIDSPPFLDTAILCTATGVLIGLIPKLHQAFFSPYEDGGIFNAWLISSIENLGTLFTSLQVFLVGCKLGVSFQRMKRSSSSSSSNDQDEEEGSGRVPIKAVLVVYTIRLILWPIVSILTTYLIIRYTSILPHDPILWFTLMVLPTGPPALINSGLAELSDQVTKADKMAIAKMLAIMYALSPSICFTITGALKATEAVRTR
ncbi:Auxin Efflux Carrier superfamily [Talaromyces stipitatus ATCC 10500]|uniref:Auxin Efflux Carrier superfamily n=1 Tax=Talaromyces stipitatus (strain ATCC 10500 / CBS 375.48 / QM 6759 / NRRL 1006) TaxID=441959 RepID=B8MBF2_TALSN|nr:Auxin Efflux Carrier superfamily [Talaromyces stipitatus ATCC 10500]EED17816.1 Auxin Efflux Carrier superfamily [Talaromyces stipitatus ATCC 10500]